MKYTLPKAFLAPTKRRLDQQVMGGGKTIPHKEKFDKEEASQNLARLRGEAGGDSASKRSRRAQNPRRHNEEYFGGEGN